MTTMRVVVLVAVLLTLVSRVDADETNAQTDEAAKAHYIAGAHDYVGFSAVGNPWQGMLDEFGIWNRALVEYEMTELYNGGAGITLFP